MKPTDTVTATVKSALNHATAELAKTSDSPPLDAELLLAHCLEKDRSWLYTWPEKTLLPAQLDCFQKIISERLEGIPVAYLTGSREFWSLPFRVTPDVLIPRPETELLVERVLEIISRESLRTPAILDLGTGSGAIAIALASELPGAEIIACDQSDKALEIAKQNAANNHTRNVRFIRSDWYAEIPRKDFDLIVSNPPYIDPDDPWLEGDIRHEPHQALVAGDNGMQDLTRIINTAPAYLKASGWLFMEHGYQQQQAVADLLQEQAIYSEIACHQDAAGHDRLTQARLIPTSGGGA